MLNYCPARDKLIPAIVLCLSIAFFTGSQASAQSNPGDFIDVFAWTTGDLFPGGLAFDSDGYLYVTDPNRNRVLRFDGATGDFIDVFAEGSGLVQPKDLAFGPDGNLYVGSLDNQVLRYNAMTGAFIDVFAAEQGLLGPVFGLVFGPDGHLYVSSSYSNQVLRFDGATGEFIDVFAEGDALYGLVFGPDGHLYVCNYTGNQVLRYDGTTGAFIDVFAEGDNLVLPADLVFGSDGHLYVSSYWGLLRYDGTTGAFIDNLGTGNNGSAFGPDGRLYVSSNSAVLRYDGATGAFIDAFTRGFSFDLIFGPDENLYMSKPLSNKVLRFDGTTGVFIDEFVTPGNGLDSPVGLVFGPDGHLYISSSYSDQVLRYDGTTGAFIDVFAVGNGLDHPIALKFGPDGRLYVSSNSAVLRYDGTTGAFIDVFAEGNGLLVPRGLNFGPDGHLYVCSSGSNQVLRYDGATGAFIDAFVEGNGLARPDGLMFGPDGHLYVSSNQSNQVLRYDGTTGAFIDVFAKGDDLKSPYNLIFGPDENLYVNGFEDAYVISRYVGPDVTELQALTAFFETTGGNNWTDNTNWLSGPISAWHGVTVNTEGKVIELNLAGNQLAGEIPAELSDLSQLELLDLSANNLSGSVPAELSNLTLLRTLALENNPSMSGTLPVSLTSLSALTDFSFTNTGLCENLDPAFQTWLHGISNLNTSGCIAEPATVTVNSSIDDAKGGDSFCTLREAIANANSNMDTTAGDCAAGSGVDRIEFKIPGGNEHQIILASILPAITEAVTIDGYTQPGAQVNTDSRGSNAVLNISLVGTPGAGTGLLLMGSGIVVRGLRFTGFFGAGIELNGESGTCVDNIIAGNSFGDELNDQHIAILIDGCSDNRIGGIKLESRNVMGNHNGPAVTVVSGTGNAILGNTMMSNAIGIDLNQDDASANDSFDSDEGANRTQNFPELISTFIDEAGELRVIYRVDAGRKLASYPILVEFFKADDMGQNGQFLLGRDNYATPGRTKTASLGDAASLNVNENDRLLATATDIVGNTSEFSPVLNVSSTPQEADLELAIDMTNYIVKVDKAEITFTYALWNNGPIISKDIIVDDELQESGVEILNEIIPQGEYNRSIGNWRLGELLDGDMVQLEITILTPTVTPTPVLFKNPIRVLEAATYDPNVTNNEDSLNVSLDFADLELDIEELKLHNETFGNDKTNSEDRRRERVLVRKRSKAKNRGPGRAGRNPRKTGSGLEDEIEILFNIPPEFRLVENSLVLNPSNTTSYDDNTRIWTIDALDVNEEATIDLEWEWFVESLDEVDDLIVANGYLPITGEVISAGQQDPDSTPDDSNGDDFDLIYLSLDPKIGNDIEPNLPVSTLFGFELSPNFPNPFSTETTIPITMGKEEEVSLRVYDLLGREVMTLYKGWLPAGRHEVNLRPQGLASGMYLIRMDVSGEIKTRTIIVLR